MILTFDDVGWFNNIMRGLFGGIDWLIYSLISWVLEGIFNLASLSANPQLVQIIYKRIYVILAIFMVFKLTLSFIKYLVSPDLFTDKEQGVGKLIMRTVVSLVLLVALPIVFFQPISSFGVTFDTKEQNDRTILQVVQDGVLKTLPKIILGIASSDDDTTVAKDADSNGNFMAIKMLEAFYYPSKCNSDSPAYDASGCDVSSVGLSGFDEFASSWLTEADKGGVYAYQYMWPLTTVAGVLLVVILLGMAIDIAIRVFKIMILQMIAPIPVMSYIDPKSSKDGAFSSWIKNFGSTFIDLFIKLGTIYLLLLLISKMFASGNSNLFNNGIDNIDGFMARNFVRVFLIIGLFKFVKDAPKFLKDALGMKDKGGGGGFMGKALAGMAGAAAGFAGGVMSGGLSGGLSGIMAGASAGAAGNAGKAFAQVRDEQAKLLGKTPGGIKGKLQNKAMQRSVMKHTGLDKDKLKTLKDDKIKAENELAIAESLHSRGELDDDALIAARKKAGKAASAYESANSLAKQIGMKEGFMEENKRHGSAYIAAIRAKRAAGATKTGKFVSSVSEKVSELPDEIRDSATDFYDISRYKIDSMHGKDASKLFDDRIELRDAKKEYKGMLRGGIGNSASDEDINDAQQKVKDARDQYRSDKQSP